MTVQTVPGETAARRRSDLLTRAVSGLAMILVALTALSLGGIAFWLLTTAAALLMLAEWGGLMRASIVQIGMALLLLALAMMLASPFWMGPDRNAVVLLIGAALLVAMVSGRARLGAGLIYAGLPAISLLYLRDLPQGIWLTLWTLAIIWATDIGAYFSGRRFGGPRLAPLVSPNKTWAGLIGGMVAAGCIGALIAGAVGLPDGLLLLAAPMAFLAQMGDLFESWLKRKAGIKDSGRLLPGHGGALDRLDGAVPVAILMATLFAGGVL